MIDIGSICSGMGMGLHGLGTPKWGIEYDEKIAQVYKLNHPTSQIYVQPVESIIPSTLQDVDLIIATPSCQNASIAKGESIEAPEDYRVGQAIAQIISTKLPKFFMLENVWGYRNFDAFKTIIAALNRNGYYLQYYHLNLADWGIAQSRFRLYLLAIRHGAFWDVVPPQLPKVGWYEAIADLIPELPESQLCDWQLKKFPNLSQVCLIPDHSNWTPLVPPTKPANTIRAGHTTFKALVKRAGGGRDSDRLYLPSDPPPTIKAMCGQQYRQLDAIVGDAIVCVTPRACLRFFGNKEIADNIWLPPQKGLATKVVGNGASWQIFGQLFNHLQLSCDINVA